MVGHNVVLGYGVQLPFDVFIGNNVTIREGCIIGEGVVIGHNTVIEEDCKIGAGTRIQALCYLAKGTVIDRDVFIGPMVCTTNDKRILSHGRGEFKPNAPTIGYGARIGARALIMPGVSIGTNALVGAGSIVNTDIYSEQVCYGAKAEITGTVPEGELIHG